MVYFRNNYNLSIFNLVWFSYTECSCVGNRGTFMRIIITNLVLQCISNLLLYNITPTQHFFFFLSLYFTVFFHHLFSSSVSPLILSVSYLPFFLPCCLYWVFGPHKTQGCLKHLKNNQLLIIF